MDDPALGHAHPERSARRLRLPRIYAALALFAFLLHFVWEMLQVPGFAGMAEADHWDATLFCLRATLGDVLILWVAYAAAGFAVGDGAWIVRWSVRPVGTFVVVGVTITVVLEWLNTAVLDRWAYAQGMPIIAGVGLAPLLQWLLIPPLVLWLARRHLGMTGSSA